MKPDAGEYLPGRDGEAPPTPVKPPAARAIDDGPFAWVSKAALRKIREGLENDNAVTSGIAVYVALAEIASDEQSPQFTTTQAHIAEKSGVSIRTVAARQQDLEELELILKIVPDLRAPAHFTLLAFGNGCRAFGNGPGNGCRDLNKPKRTGRKEFSKKW